MTLSDSILKRFAKTVNEVPQKQNSSIYGVASVDNSGNVKVKLAGSNTYIPATSQVVIQDGDKVEVDLSSRQPKVIGNTTTFGITLEDAESISNTAKEDANKTAAQLLAESTKTWNENLKVLNDIVDANAKTAKAAADNAAKVASNYLNYDTNGLVIGNMTSGTLGYNVQIKSDGINIRNGETVLATYGQNAVINNLYANTGTIGGWHIADDRLWAEISSDEYGKQFMMIRTGRGWTGRENTGDVFMVRTGDGTDVHPYDYPFVVRADGSMQCFNALISGDLRAKNSIKLYSSGYNNYVSALAVNNDSSGWSLNISSDFYLTTIGRDSDVATVNLVSTTLLKRRIISEYSSELGYEQRTVRFGMNQNSRIGFYNDTASAWALRCDDAGAYFRGVYQNTTKSSANIHVDSSNHIQMVSGSSRRWKTGIVDLALDDVKGLYTSPVRSFRYIEGYISKYDERYGKAIPGFIAEELEETFPISVDYDRLDPTDPESVMTPSDWNVKMIVPAMMRLIQDLNDRLTILESAVTKQPLNRSAMLHPPAIDEVLEHTLSEVNLQISDTERAQINAERIAFYRAETDA